MTIIKIDIFFHQAIAGYDNGLDPRQPTDVTVPEYTKEVRKGTGL